MKKGIWYLTVRSFHSISVYKRSRVIYGNRMDKMENITTVCRLLPNRRTHSLEHCFQSPRRTNACCCVWSLYTIPSNGFPAPENHIWHLQHDVAITSLPMPNGPLSWDCQKKYTKITPDNFKTSESIIKLHTVPLSRQEYLQPDRSHPKLHQTENNCSYRSNTACASSHRGFTWNTQVSLQLGIITHLNFVLGCQPIFFILCCCDASAVMIFFLCQHWMNSARRPKQCRFGVGSGAFPVHLCFDLVSSSNRNTHQIGCVEWLPTKSTTQQEHRQSSPFFSRWDAVAIKAPDQMASNLRPSFKRER